MDVTNTLEINNEGFVIIISNNYETFCNFCLESFKASKRDHSKKEYDNQLVCSESFREVREYI